MQLDIFGIDSFPNLAKFDSGPPVRPLRVCIATEEIFGPVRNGGIASTYYHLARTLAADGHSVTVLYLKGQNCENETIEHWIEFYGSFGIEFVPLPMDDVPLACAAERWQRPMYQLYHWLKANDRFDVVHASEWRGGAYYTLLAKRQGLAFHDTLFLIKTSSPWIWNRHYSMRTVDNPAELTRMFAERMMVESADVVIGGSAHLLSFMRFKGYRLPEGRTFVQPNIIDLQDLQIEEARPPYAFGDKVKSGELVFFGRLEARKGLEIFCDALNRIVRDGVAPKQVTFLGKQGNRLPSRPDIDIIPYIRECAERWPFPIEILSEFDQDKALGYLCAEPRIAVMPSLIENSTMAVYEAIVHKIPFIATRVGGTPELIDPAYHDATLTAAHPEPLAEALKRVLRSGGTVAKGAFAYEENLSQWRNFHNFLANEIAASGAAGALRSIAQTASGSGPAEPTTQPAAERVSVCIYNGGRPAFLDTLLAKLAEQERRPDEILVINDGPVSKRVNEVTTRYGKVFRANGWKVLDRPHRCIGPSWNDAAAVATGDLLVFLNAERHLPEPGMIARFLTAAKTSPAAAFTAASRVFEHSAQPDDEADASTISLPMGGDIATAFFYGGSMGGQCFAVRKAVFDALGGFADVYHIDGVEQEFHARLIMQGHDLEVIPEPLYRWRFLKDGTQIDYNDRSTEYLSILPVISAVPFYLEHILLAGRAMAPAAVRARTQLRQLQKENAELRQQISGDETPSALNPELEPAEDDTAKYVGED